jgi:hypothetical protein
LPPPFHGTQKRFQKIKLINLDEVRCVKSRLNCIPFFFDKPVQLPNVQFNFHLKAQSVRVSNPEHGLVQVSDKVKVTIYLVAELIAKTIKPHTFADTMMLAMLWSEAE